jgi:molybdate transport system substrate-binding protein
MLVRMVLGALTLMASTAGAGATAQVDPVEVSVFAAGSLRAAFTDAANEWQISEPNARVRFTFGASGLLKDRLMHGERADVFASANMEHPQALEKSGLGLKVKRFATNALCALVRPGLAVTSNSLVERLLDPAVKLGTSTPGADPSGDYAWKMFRRIEQTGTPDAFKTLSTKALQLTGGPQSPPPAGHNVYGGLVEQGAADVFITYCTNSLAATREQPTHVSVTVPDAINVSASYGIVVLKGASAQATNFAGYLVSREGQAVLARHGFSPR